MKFWKASLITGGSYALCFLVGKLLFNGKLDLKEISLILLSGLIFGVLFTFFTTWFAKYQMKKIVIELSPDEHVIKEGGANHFVGYEGVGGKLMLTNNRLVFKSHKLNIQTHQFEVPRKEIETLSTGKSIGILTNVLFVTARGERHKFIVNEPGEWVELIGLDISMTA